MISTRLLTTVLLIAATAGAQIPDGSAQRAALDRLSWLEGEWRGPGWMVTGPNERHLVNQTEKLFRAAGRTVLVIQGLGTSGDPGADPTRVVHDAFAVISWDAESKRYLFRSFIANGSTLEATAEVSDKKLVWGFETPQSGKIRYTIALTTAGDWNEIGERSSDAGATWTKFFEMNLRKH